MKKIWLPAFLLVSIINLVGVAMGNKNLILFTKPLLMPLLAMWLAMETYHQPPRFLKRTVFAGLAFATAGDVLLLNGEQPLFFILGLVAFLFTHLSYTGGFSSVSNLDNGFLRRNPSLALPFVFFSLGLVWWLWAGIPAAMQIPVAIYATVITIMALSVVNLKGRVTVNIFSTLLAGAILFMLSDSLIAASRFGSSFPFPGFLIMATYLAGQFLIVKGVRDILVSA